jgi:hypothetical protein
VPRSDSGRAAARGGLWEVEANATSQFRAKFRIIDTKRSWGPPEPTVAPPRRWRASARPSSAEEGSRNIYHPQKRALRGRFRLSIHNCQGQHRLRVGI